MDHDIVIIGAGFSGLYTLHSLRSLPFNLSVKVLESAPDVGGVWQHNKYPGARVDSEWPFYQLSMPEAWKDWNFTERFPCRNEILGYLRHVTDKLDLRKDISFNTFVSSCQWDKTTARWTVHASRGKAGSADVVMSCKYVVLCSGVLHKPYVPNIPDMEKFGGPIFHSSRWPDGLDLVDKRVAVIGVGSTGVQIVEEVGKQTKNLSVFVRKPNICFPMNQRQLSKAEQASMKPYYGALFNEGRRSVAGLPASGYSMKDKGIYDVSEAERQQHYEKIWALGSFHYVVANFPEIFTDLQANKIAYDFWAKKTRAQMRDPRKRDILAPLEPPYPFLSRRSPLVQDFYQIIDREDVNVFDLNKTPIQKFTPTGIITTDEKDRTKELEQEFDCIILATGFDGVTGSYSNIKITGSNDRNLTDLWAEEGISTYLGTTVNDYPNLFFVHGPLSPSTLGNAPPVIESQVDWIAAAIRKLHEQVPVPRSIQPTAQAQKEWTEFIDLINSKSLTMLGKSWWTNGNVPGKKPQALTYTLGLGHYENRIKEALKDFDGFEVVA